MNFKILTITALLTFTFGCKNEPKHEQPTATVLKGEVFNRPESDTLVLAKLTQDFREENLVEIPITNGKFEYTFVADETEMYQLASKKEINNGMYLPIRFISDKGTVHLKIYNSENYIENTISGTEGNDALQNYLNSIFEPFVKESEELSKEYEGFAFNDFYTEAYNKLSEKISESETQEEKVVLYKEVENLKEAGLAMNELGKDRDAKRKVKYDDFIAKKYDYLNKNETETSYALLIDDMIALSYNPSIINNIQPTFKKFKEKFPNHSYTEIGENLLNGAKLKSGGQYVDFSAPDKNGDQVALNQVLAQNKVVLLDLWATWCGPCIAKSRLAKPVYEKYKDNGFTILGVAGERSNTDALEKFLEKEQWPWQNLIELDNENKIWQKYNVMNGGGGMFLIASSGEILAVDPNANELEAILAEKL